MMPLKNIFGEELNNTITSDDVLGKDVIDVEGDFIGVVETLHLDPTQVEVVGISIDKGFLRKGLIVGKEYIERIAPHAIFLNIRPSFKVKGMSVYDSLGEYMGVVTKVNLFGDRNRIKSVVVKSVFKKTIIIEAVSIKRIGDNVLLNETKKDLHYKDDDGKENGK